MDLSTINVLVELERIGWTYEFGGENELKCHCPFHEDEHPSCFVNTEKREFVCRAAGCGKGGDFITFLAGALKSTRRVIFEDLSSRYDLGSKSRSINTALVEKHHDAIWSAQPMLKELHCRGVADHMIRAHRIGFSKGRITIPIYNEGGLCVNVRRYSPGAVGSKKMLNTRGHGSPVRLFPIDQLRYDKIVVCGGEMKAIVIAAIVNCEGIGAICTTAGEGYWHSDFTSNFKSKVVYVCFDVDDSGISAANKLCGRLRNNVEWVGSVLIPLDRDKYPKGDINDWVGREGATKSDILRILDDTEEWKMRISRPRDDDRDPVNVRLKDAVHAKHTGRRVRVKAIVSTVDTTPYVVPSRVSVTCDRNQPFCELCPVKDIRPSNTNNILMDVSPESEAIICMVSENQSVQHTALMNAFKIPTCKTVMFDPIEFCNVQDVLLSPQLEISNTHTEHVSQPALSVGYDLNLNDEYELVGRAFPHPRSQQAVLLISEYKASQDALSTYDPTAEELDDLKIFRPTEWTEDGIREKLKSVYDDFASNVTGIFERWEMHFVVDLGYHSPLLIEFDNEVVKGWTEILILGDSAQGKTETFSRMMSHYDVGEKLDCKNATIAGLLGGLKKTGDRWFITWGALPTHDRRLLFLEELKGASVEVISKLTDVRSSGIAEIPKIERGRTHARTRLVAVSNPRYSRPLSSFNFGVEAIKELVGSLEDIRRFDLSLLVSADDVSPSMINKLRRNRPRIKHQYTGDICKRCVLWAWTRTSKQVIFDDEARDMIINEATKLCTMFSEQIPLIDGGSMRYKLARLSAALACRTFSTDDTLMNVIIRKCHANFISQFIRNTYSSNTFGYLDFTKKVRIRSTLLTPNEIIERIGQTPFNNDLVEQMLCTDDIELTDLCNWCGWDRDSAALLLSFLVRTRALERHGRSYRKSSRFIELLKKTTYEKVIEGTHDEF